MRLWPFSHRTVHALQLPLQSRGQASSPGLQSALGGHAAPPPTGATVCAHTRFAAFSHAAEHALQLPWQSTSPAAARSENGHDASATTLSFERGLFLFWPHAIALHTVPVVPGFTVGFDLAKYLSPAAQPSFAPVHFGIVLPSVVKQTTELALAVAMATGVPLGCSPPSREKAGGAATGCSVKGAELLATLLST